MGIHSETSSPALVPGGRRTVDSGKKRGSWAWAGGAQPTLKPGVSNY